MGNESSNLITQIDFARAGQITPAMRVVAEKEGRSAEFIREGVAAGRIAIPANIHHTSLSPEGVGEGLRTKVNVNLGISGDLADESVEWQKVDTAIELGAEAIMDLSNSGKTQAFRTKLIEKSPAMIGTVPMYDAIGYLEKALIAIKAEDFLDVVRRHAEDGVDFVTIHAGMNRRTIESFKETGRLMNIVSRGGSSSSPGWRLPAMRTRSTNILMRFQRSCTSTMCASPSVMPCALVAPMTQPTPGRSPSSSRSASSPSALGTPACRSWWRVPVIWPSMRSRRTCALRSACATTRRSTCSARS